MQGHPLDPLSDEELEAKFRKYALRVMDEAQVQVCLDALWKLEDATDLRALMGLFELTEQS